MSKSTTDNKVKDEDRSKSDNSKKKNGSQSTLSERQKTWFKKLALSFLGLLVLAIVLVIILFCLINDSNYRQETYKEAAKSLFYFISVVLIGGPLTASLKEYDRIRQERERLRQEARNDEEIIKQINRKEVEGIKQENRLKVEKLRQEERVKKERLLEEAKLKSDIRSEYLKRVGASYRLVKSVRRELRSVGLTTLHNGNVTFMNPDQVTFYQNSMSRLNEAQLELEALKIEAISLPSSVGLSEAHDHLETMEKYLGKILKEFQKYNPKLIEDSNKVNFSSLSMLIEFTNSSKQGFEPHLATPHDQIIKLVADRAMNLDLDNPD